ncbi:GFA family protein [Aureimonas fodinaquatilis]|uniref:GFA family protein n=1 Tax=Aureimonas fodinaquatilis TaxID=2565783 RepID=A0A5B0DXD3_9HYPH|nr:GFA family protein [Aureimonas fodinaquatilis]KAA0971018.1 GFA family protein [Aureimonas fodinaquatilis]
MTLDNRPFYTGGCQCGAVRFRIEGALGKASICHCRMCQKAFGNFFAPLVSVEPANVQWTKAEPARFQSSNHVKRGFCPQCGTPLTYEPANEIALAIAAFDDPSAIAPEIQYGMEGRLPYTDSLAQLPQRTTVEDVQDVEWLADIVSFQHPDHEK